MVCGGKLSACGGDEQMGVVGFDFGTTNSLISVVRGSRIVNFLGRRGTADSGRWCVTRGAQKSWVERRSSGLRRRDWACHGNIIRSPKKYLGRDGVTVEGVERSPVEIVADLVGHVLEQARASGGARARDLGRVDGAVVTIPVDMAGMGRRGLRDAFKRAGLRIVQFIQEPFAALYGFFRKGDLAAALGRYDGKLVLVFDWGGGTLDLTL